MANTWDQIVEKVEEALKKQNFTRAQDEAEEGGRSAVFTGEALAYAVTFTPSTKRIELRTCAMKEDRSMLQVQRKQALLSIRLTEHAS